MNLAITTYLLISFSLIALNIRDFRGTNFVDAIKYFSLVLAWPIVGVVFVVGFIAAAGISLIGK